MDANVSEQTAGSTPTMKSLLIYLLTAFALSPGGSSTVHIYTHTHTHTHNTQNDTKQAIHRTTQQFGRVRAVPRLG